MYIHLHYFIKLIMTNIEIRVKLIAAGVKNLIIFGYPEANYENILTDELYRAFFESMLHDNIGQGGKQVDDVIVELLKEIEVK